MTQTIQKTLRDSAAARWMVLLLLAFAMFCSYIFMDILSPIKDLMQSTRGWDSTAFGTMQGSETFLNVFVFFLIFAGIILDKMGVRFTALLSGVVMLIGATINWYAVTEAFQGTALEVWFNNNLNYIPGFDELGISPFYLGMPASAKLSAVGFMIFGCGVEMAGITVSRGIVKWFKGREMALAMGSEMALARLGVATCMIFSPVFARMGGVIDVSRSVAFGVILLFVALIMFIVYFFMDKKLDDQTGEAEEKDEPFKISDIGRILSNSGFWIVALLCVLYYSAIFPFQKYAVNMLQCNLSFTEVEPGSFWASNTVTIIQYIIMWGVAVTSFASNFSKKKNVKNTMFLLAFILLVIFCYMLRRRSGGSRLSLSRISDRQRDAPRDHSAQNRRHALPALQAVPRLYARSDRCGYRRSRRFADDGCGGAFFQHPAHGQRSGSGTPPRRDRGGRKHEHAVHRQNRNADRGQNARRFALVRAG